MEALQNYHSDSDDDTTDNVEECQLNARSLKDVQKLECDFFNLNDSNDDNKDEPLNKMRKIVDEKVVLESGEKLTVPGTDFWRPLSEEIQEPSSQRYECSTNLKPLCKTSESYCKRRYFKSFNDKKHLQQSASYQKQNETANKRPPNHHKIERTNDLHVDKVGTKPNTNDNIPERKLFESHWKVSPWLQRQNITCKLPLKCEQSWKGHEGCVNKVKWNISQYSHLLLSVSMDTTVKIWNPWSRVDKCVKTFRLHSKGVQDCDWSRSGRQILTCSYDKKAIVTEVETGQIVCSHGHNSYATCGKFHPVDDNIILVGLRDELVAWDIRQKDEPIHVYSYKDKIGQIQDVVFNRDGSEFYSSGDLISRDSADRNIMAWDFNNAIVRSNQIYQERFSCTKLKLHPVDNNFLAQSHGNYIALFSSVKPYKICKSIRYEGHKLAGYKVGFDISPDGKFVISGDAEGKLVGYDYLSGRLIKTLKTSLDVNIDVTFHPLLPSTVACCGWNGNIELWS